MSSNHVEAFFVLLFSVLFCFVSVLFIVRTHRSRDATTIAKKKYNSRFEEQCYQINIRKNYMVWLSFGLPNAKNCSKLRTVKIADHDCLLTVAYNLKTCRTMKLASDQSLTNEAMLAPHWINSSHLIYSSVPQALACYFHTAGKKSAYPESYVIHVRTMSANHVEILYFRLCCVMSINSEMNLVFST